MARYKKELTECARNLKLPFLAEHLDEILHPLYDNHLQAEPEAGI